MIIAAVEISLSRVGIFPKFAIRVQAFRLGKGERRGKGRIIHSKIILQLFVQDNDKM